LEMVKLTALERVGAVEVIGGPEASVQRIGIHARGIIAGGYAKDLIDAFVSVVAKGSLPWRTPSLLRST